MKRIVYEERPLESALTRRPLSYTLSKRPKRSCI